MDSTKEYYTTEEAATFLGLSHSTVRWHIHKGHVTPIPHDKIPPEVRRFLRKNAPLFMQKELTRFASEKRAVGKPAKNSSKNR
jgi:hypothetical protein